MTFIKTARVLHEFVENPRIRAARNDEDQAFMGQDKVAPKAHESREKPGIRRIEPWQFVQENDLFGRAMVSFDVFLQFKESFIPILKRLHASVPGPSQ